MPSIDRDKTPILIQFPYLYLSPHLNSVE